MSDEPDIPLSETYKAGEAAEIMAISPRKLKKLIEAGELRTLSDPRNQKIIRIPRADIDRWLKKAGPPARQKKPPNNTSRRPAA